MSTPQDQSQDQSQGTVEEGTPSSGSFVDPSTGAGTAGGDPLAGVDRPDEPPVYPDGADETLEG